MHGRLRFVVPLLTLVIFVTAMVFLRGELKHYHYHDIRDALLAIPAWRIAAAVGLTILNYIVLVGYDWLSVAYLRLPLGAGKLSLASFVGHVSSFNLGAVLGGTPVRYRLYTAWGLSNEEVFKLIALSTATFWIGFLALAGVVFLLEPLGLPPALHIPFHTATPIGVVLVAGTLFYFGLSAAGVTLRWREWEFAIPPLWLSLAQALIAATDLLIAAAVLHVLLPESAGVSYGDLLAVYLLAVVAVLFTHVPGGLGILELVVLELLAPTYPAEVVGALLAFRVIYYLLPLALAGLLLVGHEIVLRREAVGKLGTVVGRWAPAVAPRLLSILIFLAGASLLLGGAMPAAHGRLAWLHDVLPLGVIEASHLLGSVCGVVLLLLARGLQLRLDSAYWLTAAALVAGILLSLSRGLEYEQALGLIAVLLVLMPCHRYFYRHAALLNEPFTPDWLAAIAAILIASVWLASFCFKHVEYTDELWWKFALKADAPRALRAGVAVAATVLVLSLAHLLRFVFPKPHPPNAEELAAARAIVAKSPRSSASLALLGDKWFLFNAARTAFVMYRVERRSWIALGDPVGPPDERKELAWEFRELSEHYGGWTVFYQVEQDNLPLYLDMGLLPTKLGEEGRVPLADFSLEGSQRKALRHTRAKLERENCRFEMLPASAVPPLLDELREISAAWLATKQAQEKGFSLGSFSERYLSEFPLAIVRSGQQIVAFANVWPGAEHAELSVDLMRYLPSAPAGVMDYLFTELMLWGRAEGYQWFNLGMAPLAGLGGHALAPRLHRLGGLVFRHGDHFYNFQGLREYKDKFKPVWTAKYLAAPGGLALPRILAHLTALIGKTATTSSKQLERAPRPAEES